MNEQRSAHSLIETLVVLIIVGALLAIIVPAVQRSREAARDGTYALTLTRTCPR